MLTPPQSLSPDQLHGLFTEACRMQTAGRLDEARENYLLLLRFLPDESILHYNIGLVYYRLENFAQALREFSLASTDGQADADTLFNLALCQNKTGDRRAAIATYRRILEVTPEDPDCLYNLAGCYRDDHEEEQAITLYHLVLAGDPHYLPAANNLAYLYHRRGEVDRAVIYYRQVLALRPEDDAAGYMLAALLGTPLASAPDSYVRDFFDTYAESFEQSLVVELEYDNPRQLYQCFCTCSGHQARYDHGLDLGCGTGLGGAPFSEVVALLDGVDLSRSMLALASQKGWYRELHPDSILHHLQSTAETYDFFLATDVFIYVGDLQEIFTAAQAIARPAALFCFSTENLEVPGYRLRTTGRFAYSPAYVHHLAESTGWTVLTQEETGLRKERESWISGDLWIMQLQMAKT